MNKLLTVLIKRQENDARKAALAHRHNIPIVYFNYRECITPVLVQNRLNKHINNS